MSKLPNDTPGSKTQRVAVMDEARSQVSGIPDLVASKYHIQNTVQLRALVKRALGEDLAPMGSLRYREQMNLLPSDTVINGGEGALFFGDNTHWRFTSTGGANVIPATQRLTCSIWVYWFGTTRHDDSSQIQCILCKQYASGTAPNLRFAIENDTGVVSRNILPTATAKHIHSEAFVVGWNHIAYSCDWTLGVETFVVNGVNDVPGDFAPSGSEGTPAHSSRTAFNIGKNKDSGGGWPDIYFNHALADFWYDEVYTDFTDPAMLAKFYSPDGRVALGPNGELGSVDGATSPRFYLNGNADVWNGRVALGRQQADVPNEAGIHMAGAGVEHMPWVNKASPRVLQGPDPALRVFATNIWVDDANEANWLPLVGAPEPGDSGNYDLAPNMPTIHGQGMNMASRINNNPFVSITNWALGAQTVITCTNDFLVGQNVMFTQTGDSQLDYMAFEVTARTASTITINLDTSTGYSPSGGRAHYMDGWGQTFTKFAFYDANDDITQDLPFNLHVHNNALTQLREIHVTIYHDAGNLANKTRYGFSSDTTINSGYSVLSCLPSLAQTGHGNLDGNNVLNNIVQVYGTGWDPQQGVERIDVEFNNLHATWADVTGRNTRELQVGFMGISRGKLLSTILTHTNDDGNITIYTVEDPGSGLSVFEKFGDPAQDGSQAPIPCLLGIIGEDMGTPRRFDRLTDEQVDEMHASGYIQFGTHGRWGLTSMRAVPCLATTQIPADQLPPNSAVVAADPDVVITDITGGVVTTAAPHGYGGGNIIVIKDVAGPLGDEVNWIQWRIVSVGASNFTLENLVQQNPYVSGGTSHINNAIIAGSVDGVGTTFRIVYDVNRNNGVASAGSLYWKDQPVGNNVISSVTGNCTVEEYEIDLRNNIQYMLDRNLGVANALIYIYPYGEFKFTQAEMIKSTQALRNVGFTLARLTVGFYGGGTPHGGNEIGLPDYCMQSVGLDFTSLFPNGIATDYIGKMMPHQEEIGGLHILYTHNFTTSPPPPNTSQLAIQDMFAVIEHHANRRDYGAVKIMDVEQARQEMIRVGAALAQLDCQSYL